MGDIVDPTFRGMRYAYTWSSKHHPGFVVYRKFLDLPDHAWQSHIVACFVMGEDAKNYCFWKNNQEEKGVC